MGKRQRMSRPPASAQKGARKAEPGKPSLQSAAQQAKPTIPFAVEDRILLVGEGDFSFAQSLVLHHGCASLTATCYDSEQELLEKYPQAKAHISCLLQGEQRVLYRVDATKLASRKELRKGERFDRIVFNFPHVGGVTKDVNRQVRYNQELLVGFFKSAIPLLKPDGAIVVTLFEGEPYTLWNIRDLARHCGLKVGRSFRFESAAYPEYKHARTLGNIEGGGGWKGETRQARSFIFEVNHPSNGGSHKEKPSQTGQKKRKRDESSSDDGED